MSARKPRIHIPRNPEELIKLVKKLCKKHLDDGPESPLLELKMDDFKFLCEQAEKQHTIGEDYRQKAEQSTELRDQALGLHTTSTEDRTARWYAMAARDVLLG